MKKIILFNIIIISIVTIILEIFLRLFLDTTPQGVSRGIIDIESSNPNFNYVNIENGRVFGARVFTDENGFRISKGELNNFDNLNTYFIGGSVTFGNGIEQSKTFTGILNNKFKKINVHNASVIGSDIKNNYFILKNKVKMDKIDKIFISFSLDDLDGVPKNLESNLSPNNQNSIFHKLKKNTILVKINNFIRSKSVIYVWTKGVVFNSEKKYYEFSLNAFKNKDNLKYLEKYLDLIKILSKNNFNKVNFILLPYTYQLKDNNCKNKDLAEKLIEKNLKKRGFKYIVVKDYLCQDKNKKKIFLKHDPAHLSKYGHKALSKILYDYM